MADYPQQSKTINRQEGLNFLKDEMDANERYSRGPERDQQEYARSISKKFRKSE